jgi:integrase
MIQRNRTGTVWLDGRTWWFRAGFKQPAKKLGSIDEIGKTKTAARKAAQTYLSEANDPQSGVNVVLNEVIKQYRKDEMPRFRKCTSRVYECWLENHIIPKWGRTSIVQIEAYEVKTWLESLDMSGKSRAEIRGVLRQLLRFSMLRKFQKQGPNPMDLVDLKETKRKSKPRILTVEEFKSLVTKLEEPFKTMACVALFHGLRVSELLGLKWGDVNWFDKSLTIQRSVVCQIEGVTKTPASQANFPWRRKNWRCC